MENKRPQTKTPSNPQKQQQQPSKPAQPQSNKAPAQQKKPGSNW